MAFTMAIFTMMKSDGGGGWDDAKTPEAQNEYRINVWAV